MYQAAGGSFAGLGGGAEFWVVGKIVVDGEIGTVGVVTPVKDGKPGNWLVMSVNQSSGGG